MSFNQLQIVLYTGRPSLLESPINIPETSSRSDSPAVQQHHLEAIAKGMESVKQTEAARAANKVMNGSLLHRLKLIEGKKTEMEGESKEYDDLVDKIDKCQEKWHGLLSSSVEKIRNQAEVVKMIPNPQAQVVVSFKVDVNRLDSFRSELAKETKLIELKVLSYQNSEYFNLLDQQIVESGPKERLGDLVFGLNQKLIDKLGRQYIQSLATFLREVKQAGQITAFSTQLSTISQNLAKLQKKMEILIASVKYELQTTTADDLIKAASNFQRIEQEIKKLTAEREQFPWALVSSLKTDDQKQAYIDEFSRRLKETADDDDPNAVRFMGIMAEELKNKEMFFAKDLPVLFSRLPKEDTDTPSFTSNDVGLIFVEMFEIQSDLILKKREIEKLKIALKEKKELLEDASQKLLRHKTQQFASTEDYFQEIDLLFGLTNGLDLIKSVSKTVKEIAK